MDEDPSLKDPSLKDIALNESSAVRDYYDRWTASYEDDVASWGYDAPTVAVDFLAELVDTDAPVSYTHLTLPTIYSV